MEPVPFRLRPFGAAGVDPAISIEGWLARLGDVLSVRWELRGDRSGLWIPEPDPSPRRTERLWEGTCFELFVAPKGSGGYWEFNLSPSGRWDVYRFSGYREQMRREPAFRSLPFEVRSDPGALALALALDIGKIVPRETPLRIGVSAVLKPTAGPATFWALRHAGPRPDFHRRDDFLLSV